mgnify:FL=1
MNATPSLRPNRALAFVNVSHFLNHVIMLIYPTVALTLVDVWSISYGELFKLFFIGSMLYGVAALPAGWLGDRWSSWGMLAIYMIGTGIATFLTGFANSPTQIAIGLGVTGVFAAIYHPVGTNFVVQHAVNRAKDLGFNGAFGTVGLAAAAFIAAGLTQLWGWRAAFFIPGIACFLLGVGFVLFTKASVKGKNEATSAVEDAPVSVNTTRLALGLMAVTALSVGLITQAYTSGLPKVFDDTMQTLVANFTLDREGGLTMSSGLVTLVILAGAVGQIVGGSLASKYSPKAVYICMFAIMIPLALLASQLNGVALVAVAAVMMLAITGCLPAENCIIVRFCPENWRARVFSAKFVIALGGGSFAVLAVGEIFNQTTDFSWFYGFLIGLAVVVMAFAAFLPSMKNSVEGAAPVSGSAE